MERPRTLRDAVIGFFRDELARYGGRPDVVFDRTDEKVLELAGPAYEFRVRRGAGAVLGLVPVTVEVLMGGAVAQCVPMAVQVSMIRPVVIASRSINQDATIRAADVEVLPVTLSRVDQLGIAETAQVIGQRAKRFLPAGSTIEPGVLEAVPLVTRGQIVTLTAAEGAVQIVTTASAMRDGRGETITVRSSDNQRVEFDAVVVGRAAVHLGAPPAGLPSPPLAEAGSR
jgi:flagella basal body P-ring formation protein FlgA